MHNHSINAPTDDSLSDRDFGARQAGHAIYNSLSSASSTSRLLESGSLSNSWVIPENQRACCGIMSPVRRTFCLITLFDLILTFILWVIYTQILADSFFQTFADQVINYTFKTSLFDTVMCAAWRFVPLLLAYALFRINNPWVVALTTLGTCVFLLAKVFLFNFTKDKDNIMCYLLLIISFILAWVETWFLDFKVLPREQKARERGDIPSGRVRCSHRVALVVILTLFILPQAYLYGFPSERTPLLDGAAARNNYQGGDQYYSPVNSPEGSDDEDVRIGDDFHSIGRSRNVSRSSGSLALSLGAQEQEYIKKSREVWEKLCEMYQTTDAWKLESGSSHATPEQGCVHSRVFAGIGKVYRLQGYVDASPKLVFNELVLRVTDSPKWSSTVLECRILTYLDDTTSILYTIAAEAAGGFVSSRDFVNLNHYAPKDGVLVSSASAVTHPQMPVSSDHVRGENGPGGYVFKPVPGNPNKCLFIQIINTDLKGWIPQYMVDQALSGVLIQYHKDVQKRVAQVLKSSKRDQRR